jgi:hypothetical protein
VWCVLLCQAQTVSLSVNFAATVLDPRTALGRFKGPAEENIVSGEVGTAGNDNVR